jgi:hypothetical protein
MTYTLAIGADMLLATVPDGGDIAASVQASMASIHGDIEFDTFSGCTLTDDEPDDRHASCGSGLARGGSGQRDNRGEQTWAIVQT